MFKISTRAFFIAAASEQASYITGLSTHKTAVRSRHKARVVFGRFKHLSTEKCLICHKQKV